VKYHHAVAALACAASLAACSGGSAPKAAEPVDTQPAATGIRCAAIDRGLLTRDLGGTYAEPKEIRTGSITVCSYTAAGALGAVTIRVDVASNATKFAGARTALTANKQRASVVAGLGDEAFSAALSAGGLTVTTLDARLGATEILISSGADVAHEKALVKSLFPALGPGH
jgi:hypothetical protein